MSQFDKLFKKSHLVIHITGARGQVVKKINIEVLKMYVAEGKLLQNVGGKPA